MTPETAERIVNPSPAGADKRKSIGMGSVIRRIELEYGPPYGVELDTAPGEGTTVRLKLPYGQLESEDL